jgi:hypothetical protein
MIKNYKNFVGESVENRGKGPGNSDLLPNTPFKQKLNRSDQTMDLLRIGKHIFTGKIDGFIESVQNDGIYITDRQSGETRVYTLKEVLKEISKTKSQENKNIPIEGFSGTPKWAQKPSMVKEKIEAVHTILTPEDELEDEEIDDITESGFSHGMYRDTDYPQFVSEVENDDEELTGDTYNPGILNDVVNSQIYDDIEIEELNERTFRGAELRPEEKRRLYDKIGVDLEEDEDEEHSISKKRPNFMNRGTEDNPEGNVNPISESWNKYWETFDPLRERLEEEDYEDVMDINPDIFEEEKEEDEYEEPEGSEDNPIQMRRRLKIEDYSEDNPEPQYGDDRFDQFGFDENENI